jgi:Flp pilus assembly protein TadG
VHRPALRPSWGRLAREDGQAIIFVALAIGAILTVLGLVVDGSRLFVNHRQMQTAADAAALAGAWDVVHNDGASIQPDVNWYAAKNGYTGPTIIPCNDPAGGPNDTRSCWKNPYNGHNEKIEVRL